MLPPTRTHSVTVRCFSGPDMAGNIARVSRQTTATSAPLDGQPVVCQVEDLAPGRVGVTCFGPSGSIRFCGHGLLACAGALVPDGGQITLISGAQEVVARRRGPRCWLSLPVIPCSPCPVPTWVRGCFNLPPQRAALAGGDSDYLILEWPWTTPLASLELNEQLLCQQTQRAIIAVQPDPGPHCDYRLRYFAPQYGVTEDPATGSAHAVVADYWRQRLPGRTHWRGLQASRQGGMVWSHLDHGQVTIGGRFEILPPNRHQRGEQENPL